MFQSEKVSRSATIRLQGSFEQVFPLFGPVRERDWAEGWDPQILYLESDNIEKHMVFQSRPHLEDESRLYTWTVSTYDPEDGLIEYTVFAEMRLWWITIKCHRLPKPTFCEAEITYAYVGLNERGNSLNKESLEALYRHDLKDWELAINHYLKTGSRLRHT